MTRYSNEHFKIVAEIFTEASEVGDWPVAAVAESYAVSHSTASGWVQRARDLGYLEPLRKATPMDLEQLRLVAAVRSDLGRRGREVRERVGLSLDDIASQVGVTRQCVSKWERGERVPSRSLAVRYGRVLQRLDAA